MELFRLFDLSLFAPQRKEFGSMVNRRHGLSAAKDLLGHADIAITAAYYIDKPHQATSGLGALLATKRKGRKIVEFNQSAKTARRSPGASKAPGQKLKLFESGNRRRALFTVE